MPKQGKNIYLRKDGRWEGRFIKDRIAGKPHYGYVFGKTYEEAERKLNAVSPVVATITQNQNNKGSVFPTTAYIHRFLLFGLS